MASTETGSGTDKTPLPESSSSDVTAAVEELLNTLSNKFAGVSSEIFAKMDEMSRRLDNLEASLTGSKSNEEASSKSQ